MRRYTHILFLIAVINIIVNWQVNAQEPEEKIENDTCLMCHGEPDFSKIDEKKGEVSLFVENEIFSQSVHKTKGCVDCHADITEIPHETPAAVLCERCHFPGNKELAPSIQAEEYTQSIHAERRRMGIGAASCKDCHGKHDIFKKDDPRSRVYRLNIPYQCKVCHPAQFEEYSKSIHGVFFIKEKRQEAAVCIDCHSSHKIQLVKGQEWKFEIVKNCGNCHGEQISTYRKTFHGKFDQLKAQLTARCPDCHGGHNIYRPSDPRATISKVNRLDTCRKCHPEAHPKFAEYLVHANERDVNRYPVVFYVYWIMLIFITTVFSFFLIVAILWCIKEIKERKNGGHEKKDSSIKYIRRFNKLEIFLHALVIVGFIGLVLTGIALIFNYAPWAMALERLLGGLTVTRRVHRACAILTFIVFLVHLIYVLRNLWLEKGNLKEFFLGKKSLVLTFKDLKDMRQHIKWFLGRGEKPEFGHYTYWEKFEYWAFLWGLFIVGITGLLLWFPEASSKYVSGMFFNIATILHGLEAVLASMFIFIIHFFIAHLRPEKFPMDPVIFTGKIAEEELKKDRPLEYDSIAGEKEKEGFYDEMPPAWFQKYLVIIGYAAIIIGLVLIFFIATTLISAVRIYSVF